MKEFALSILDLLDQPAIDYADVRVVRRREESLHVKNGVLEAWADEEDLGFGVRVLLGGYWGFAAAHELSAKRASAVVALALEIAAASARVGGPRARLAPQTARHEDVVGRCLEDPFAIPPDEKVAFLLKATEALRGPGIDFAVAKMGAFREQKVFASTEGALISQTRTETGGGIEATAVASGDVQTRSYPSAGYGSWNQGGFEVVRGFEFQEHAPRLAEEAVALLTAPRCPEMTTTVILDADQMALQLHESVGHPTEFDRVLGSEISYAGGSFLKKGDLGHFHLGSEQVTIVADGTLPSGVGSAAFDDEGVPAQRNVLVHQGQLSGFLTSRETAPLLGQQSSGAMRASGWNRLPLIRMTNVSIQPGNGTLDELISEVSDGVLLSTNKSWSIDDLRLNFQFSTEIGWEIKNGRLGRMLRDCAYTGTTPSFWRSCDAVCGPQEWRLFGVVNCGKGEPGQVAHVGHGAAPARFHKVRVGVPRQESPGGA